MIEKHNTSLKISEENIPAILRVHGEEKDPNLQDVPRRDIPKYLREQYWIKQWGPTSRWELVLGLGTSRQLRRADLNRKLDDPGDAFFDLHLLTLRSHVSLRTWVEVTEVFLPAQAKMINMFIREYNGLHGKGKIDLTEFLKSLNLSHPDAGLQREMADEVIEAIEKKAKKGCDEGSYKSLVRDYGRGVLIVGLPMWFATLPSDPMDPSMVFKDFCMRLHFGLDAIKHSTLRASWCPFDSIVILWNPTQEAIDEWGKVANLDFYSSPSNQSLQVPLSGLKILDLPISSTTVGRIRWDRYSSLDVMLDNQFRWFRFFNKPRPLGPKACLEVHNYDTSVNARRMDFYKWLLHLGLFSGINGWGGLCQWIVSRLSVRRLYSRLLQGHRARKLYRSSLSNRSKSSVNDQVGYLK